MTLNACTVLIHVNILTAGLTCTIKRLFLPQTQGVVMWTNLPSLRFMWGFSLHHRFLSNKPWLCAHSIHTIQHWEDVCGKQYFWMTEVPAVWVTNTGPAALLLQLLSLDVFIQQIQVRERGGAAGIQKAVMALKTTGACFIYDWWRENKSKFIINITVVLHGV